MYAVDPRELQDWCEKNGGKYEEYEWGDKDWHKGDGGKHIGCNFGGRDEITFDETGWVSVSPGGRLTGQSGGERFGYLNIGEGEYTSIDFRGSQMYVERPRYDDAEMIVER